MTRAFVVAAAALIATTAIADPIQPYQQMRVANSAFCPQKQCVFAFSTIPPGKRLILSSISAQVATAIDALVVEGNGVSYFVPKTSGAGYLSQPLVLYFEAGSTPTVRTFVGNVAQNTSMIVILIGTLAPTS